MPLNDSAVISLVKAATWFDALRWEDHGDHVSSHRSAVIVLEGGPREPKGSMGSKSLQFTAGVSYDGSTIRTATCSPSSANCCPDGSHVPRGLKASA